MTAIVLAIRIAMKCILVIVVIMIAMVTSISKIYLVSSTPLGLNVFSMTT